MEKGRQKLLVGRASVIHAVREAEENILSTEVPADVQTEWRSQVQDFAQALYSLVNRRSVTSDETVTVEQFLFELKRDFAAEAVQFFKNLMPAWLASFEAELDGSCGRLAGQPTARGVVCSHCASQAEATLRGCTGFPDWCQWVRFALDVAKKWHLIPTAEISEPGVFVSIWASTDPQPAPSSIISGKVEFEVNEIGHVSSLALIVNHAHVTEQAYFSVGYLSCHECICHVYQNLRLEEVVRPKAKPTDQFSEGWMDQLAYWAFQDIVKRHSLPKASLYLRHGEQAFAGRIAGDGLHARICEQGRNAASRLNALFARVRELPVDGSPVPEMLELSGQLNTLSRSSVQREKLPLLINRHLAEDGRMRLPQDAADVRKMDGLARKYLQDRDADAFLQAFCVQIS